MCIILGNLLENAVEACQKTEGGKIELMTRTQGAHLAVMVKNSFNGTVAEENGQPVSTKKNSNGHGYRRGYGLRSVGAIAARYGGNVFTEWDTGTFTAYVMLEM